MTSRNPAYGELLDYVRRVRGVDFASYKPTTLRRRLGKRMDAVGAKDYDAYLDVLQATPHELDRLLEAVFINVTGFFRDPEAWETIETEVVPALLESREEGADLRVWSAGVASGEEAYSLAMLLSEAMEAGDFAASVKIFATDVDEDALATARAATYTADKLEGVPAPLRKRYFEPAGERFQVKTELRRAVIFGRHDVLADPPISRLDLLACRNTLMYFNREAQGRILSRFHFAIKPTGYLFLGRAEMLLTSRNLFTPADGKARLFRKVTTLSLQDRLSVLAQTSAEEERQEVMGEVRLRELAFDDSAVAEVVVDGKGTLALANAAARSLFRLTLADVGRPFQDLDLSYKPVELRGPIEAVRSGRTPSEIRNVPWKDAEGEERRLDVRLVPILQAGALVGVKVSFVDVTRSEALAEELSQSKKELEVAYEELQSTNEELETTNEELQSTVEELETTNEELQSTNEELETLNEELQSTNVELETVNDELRERTEELGRLNRYVGSVLNSLDRAVVVLDRELNVRMWNAEAEALWGLRQEEVEGKAFLALDIGLPVHELKGALRQCVAGEADGEAQILPGHDRKGKPVDHQVFCTPLKADGDGVVDGVVLLVSRRGGVRRTGRPRIS